MLLSSRKVPSTLVPQKEVRSELHFPLSAVILDRLVSPLPEIVPFINFLNSYLPLHHIDLVVEQFDLRLVILLLEILVKPINIVDFVNF